MELQTNVTDMISVINNILHKSELLHYNLDNTNKFTGIIGQINGHLMFFS